MYAERFGFSQPPFSVTPDPQIFFTNRVYQDAFAALQYGVLAKKGFVVVTGEVGTGKTTLIRKLLHSLGPAVHSVFIFNTQVNFPELLRLILDDLGLTRESEDKLALLAILNHYLIECLKQGRIVTLLIDEAQNLSDEALEGLRLLSNLETDTEKLLQIILVGQPELETKLAQPQLRQLKQRISFHCRLAPLKKEEVGAYVEFRLHAAGFQGKIPFDPEAVETIAFYSRGIPRLVNSICDNALRAAFAAGAAGVSAPMVEKAASDLRLGREPLPVEEADRVHQRMRENPAEWQPWQGPRPEFEKVLSDAAGVPRSQFHPRLLKGLGLGVFLGAIFLGGIAVSNSEQSRTTISELVPNWQDFSQRGGSFVTEWRAGLVDGFAETKAYLATKSAELYRQSIDYMDRAGRATRDLSQQTENYFAGWREKSEEFASRTQDYITDLTGRILEGMRWSVHDAEPGARATGSLQSVSGAGMTDSLANSSPNFPEPMVNDLAPDGKLPTSAEPMADPIPSAADDGRAENSRTQSNRIEEPVSAPADSRQAPKKAQARYLGKFQVVEDSFVRERPQDNAQIVSTLDPGTPIQVESKTGKYFRVRSLDGSGVSGYVHEEDAFFERRQ